MIYTKRHEIVDMMRTCVPQADPETYTLVQDVFENEQLPHYVLTEELMKALDPYSVSETCKAMAQAGVAYLPHEEMLVEGRRGKKSEFYLFSKQFGKQVGLMLLYDGSNFELYPYALKIELNTSGDIIVRGSPTQELADRVAATYLITLALSHTRGLAKEVVTQASMRQFNKARAAKKRAPVFDHTVLRVGRVYNKHGVASKYAEGGAMRRPHLRKGHARRQKYGPGWQQERWIFVPACFVNWTEGDDLPTCKPKVVTW